MSVQESFHHLGTGRLNSRGLIVIPPAKPMIRSGAGKFYRAEGMDQGGIHRSQGKGEILQSANRVNAV